MAFVLVSIRMSTFGAMLVLSQLLQIVSGGAYVADSDVVAAARAARKSSGEDGISEDDSGTSNTQNFEVKVVEYPRGSSSRFNSITFAPNVINGTGAPSDNWIVFFCYSWYDGCQTTLRNYHGLTGEISRRYNKDNLFSSAVRFAEVDCATERELCNEQKVEQYPTVVHYANGVRGKAWAGGSKGSSAAEWVAKLEKWIEKRLVPADHTPDAEQQTSGIQSSEVKLIIKAAIYFMAFATFLGAIIGHGVELWAATARLRPRAGAVVPKNPEAYVTAVEQKHPELHPTETSRRTFNSSPVGLVGVPGARLRRCFPREWSESRSSIDL